METLLDEANNRKVDNIEVKEIKIQASNKWEEGSEDMKDDLTRKVPVSEDNNEEEIVLEVPKLEMLIEDDSERGENDVIEMKYQMKCHS